MIKKIIFLSFVSIFALNNAFGQDTVRWYSIEEAFQLNAKEPRMMVIDVYTDWCGWCKRMDAATFSVPEIAARLNKNFYPVKLNAEGKEDIVIGDHAYKFIDNGRRGYHELAAIVTKGRLSYPTISCVDEQGRVIDAYPGYKDPEQFKIFLAFFEEEAYKSQSWEEYRKAGKELTVPDI